MSENTYLLTCAPNKNSNQPGHPRSLVRAFVIRMKKLCIFGCPKYVRWRFWSDCANIYIIAIYIKKTRLFKYIENFTTINWIFFLIKIPIFFHISAQNIDCGYTLEQPLQDGSNEYPESMFLSRNKKNNVYPCKPQFYHITMGFKGFKFI